MRIKFNFNGLRIMLEMGDLRVLQLVSRSVVELALPDVSNDFSAFTFRIKQSDSSTDTVSHTRIF
jgi:hypothetical protein